jgi:hypothetical protein
MLDEVEEQVCGILYLSALPPFEISAIRRLHKRVRSRFPKVRIGIGLWGYDGETDKIRALLRIAESDLIVTSLGEAVVQIQQFTELVARSQ